MAGFTRNPDPSGSYEPAARDSLELGSLASSSASAPRQSESSSASGVPSSRKISFDNDDPLTTPQAGSRGHHPYRSHSVSSAFDFAPPLFPLSSTNGYTSLGGAASLDPTLASEGVSLERHKSLTFLNGLSLTVGLIIGSGIFSSPSEVNKNTGSPGASLIVWAVAGLLVWTGAASYAELGGAMPLNGGAQMYLTKIFGDLAGFLYSWCTVCVLKPGSAALVCMIFGDYVVRAVVGAEADVNPLINKTVAIVGLTIVTIINAISTKVSMRVADVFMFFKFLALAGVAVMGVVVAITGFSWQGEANTDWKTHGWFDDTNTNLSNIAVALYAGLWAYEGWDNVNYVTGELIQPTRDLPRIVHTSLPLVIASYLMANTAYFLVLPLSVTSRSTTIATAMGYEVFGSIGSFVMALAVAGSCFGTMNAGTFTTSRLYYAAAKEGYLPSIVGTLGVRGTNAAPTHSSQQQRQVGPMTKFFSKMCSEHTVKTMFLTPIPALLLGFVFTMLYIMVGTFATLLTFYGVAGYFFYFLTVLGVIVLRVREPHLERPYRCWITTPVIFCCVSLFLLSRSIFAAPWTSMSVVPFVLVGTVIYYWKVKKRAPASGSSGRAKDAEAAGWRFWRRWRRG